jgi:hypothetical protein
MKLPRRSVLLAIAAVGITVQVAACNEGGVTGATRGKAPDAWADVVLAGLQTTTFSFRTNDGRIATHTDSLDATITYKRNGVAIKTKPRGPDARSITPASLSISNDARALSLGMVQGRVRGISRRDSSGNLQSVAFIGGDETKDGAPPGFMIAYKNGKPSYAIRSIHQKVNGRWVPTSGDFTVFDSVSGVARGQIGFNIRPTNRRFADYGDHLRSALADATSIAGMVFLPADAMAAEAATMCEETGVCDKAFEAAVKMSALAMTLYAISVALWVQCSAGNLIACATVEAAEKSAAGAAGAARFLWDVYRQCTKWTGGGEGGELSVVTIDPTDAGSVLPLLDDNDKRVAFDCPGGGDDFGDGGGCYMTWGKIEISYDGGASWETLWEGVITICDDYM